MISAFSVAFGRTMKIEGGYSNDPGDPGGETYMGISRKFWPSWLGWPVIDDWKSGNINGLQRDTMLADHVRSFYKAQFWDRWQGDVIADISLEIACEMFDTSVNMNVTRAVRFLQEALNMQNQNAKTYPDIAVDGVLGNGTINTLRRYLSSQPGNKADNESILLNCMNGEQYIFYKNNPQHEQFRGWFRRV